MLNEYCDQDPNSVHDNRRFAEYTERFGPIFHNPSAQVEIGSMKKRFEPLLYKTIHDYVAGLGISCILLLELIFFNGLQHKQLKTLTKSHQRAQIDADSGELHCLSPLSWEHRRDKQILSREEE
jgi:hypothetical protein